ncbi:thiamine pyrophosphate-binding protein [Microbacterium sp. ARD31]|uniref:thiamine pyrophosphate-binding protein n=1 Tax=Microbacterium sp. ARD31 TaxID=2962576 RepID=UPI00288282B9|nr:thiamine pyrophosphate-binding protein [Microbacterium sp. ARD31]MDT0186049.1 thiamine pyrophosphate-binding protein [Microbacterium sp. ARD31]
MTTAHETVGSQLVLLFEAAGIRAAFGIPGTHNLELYRGLSRSNIRTVTTRHEQSAAYAADAYAKTTGEPALVIATSGPAVLNALVGVGTAYAESRPLILIAPGRPSGAAKDAGELHELGDVYAAGDAMTAWSHRIVEAEEVPVVVAEALRRVRAGRRRPVFIEVPLDLLDQPAAHAGSRAAARTSTPPLDQDSLARAAALLGAASKPVIIAGGGATGLSGLRQLVEALGAVVVTTMNGKGALAETHPLSVGSSISSPSVMDVVNASDAVLAIGTELAESDLGPQRVTASHLIRVDIEQNQLDRNASPAVRLRGDAGRVIDALLPLIEDVGPARRAEAGHRVAALRAGIAGELGEDAETAHAIIAGLPGDAILTADSSQVVYAGLAFEAFCARPDQFVYMSRSATLGYALPAAIGAAVAYSDRPIVAVAGDGAFLFSCQELATVAEEQLAVTVVIVDNGGYAEIEAQEVARGIPPIGVRFTNPDFAALGRAFGIESVLCTSLDDLTEAVRAATASQAPRLISYRMNS